MKTEEEERRAKRVYQDLLRATPAESAEAAERVVRAIEEVAAAEAALSQFGSFQVRRAAPVASRHRP